LIPGVGVTGYKVLIDDNFHYSDESERVTHRVFATAEEALTACRAIVDDLLTDAFRPGMSSSDLYDCYKQFGDDPFIVPIGPEDGPVNFSAWQFARERCEAITGA
jgi:hypothetical protein